MVPFHSNRTLIETLPSLIKFLPHFSCLFLNISWILLFPSLLFLYPLYFPGTIINRWCLSFWVQFCCHKIYSKLMVRPYTGDNIYVCYWSWKSWAGVQPGASPLLTSTHCAGRYSPYYWKRKAIININQLQTMQFLTVTHMQYILSW